MPEAVIELRIKQLMEMKRLICTRNESPETCFLCEQEGKDYCMICADGFTLEEYKQLEEQIF